MTFQVNMSIQIALGNFNATSDTVSVAGDPINAWSTTDSPLTPTTQDPNIWAGTFEVTGTSGATGQYKFVILNSSGAVWEGNVGSGGGNANRTFTLADTDQVLPVVFFNNITTGTSVSTEVTFQVNMSVQIELGSFDADTGVVSVAGEFNAWNTSDFGLTRSTSNPDLWVGTRTLTGAANSSVSYKFVMNGATWEGNVGPDGAQNRSLILTNKPLVLPAEFFNNQGVVPKIIPLTFQVNLAVPIAQGSFDPETGTVSVAGDLLNSWSASASVLTRSTVDSNLWTGAFEVNSSAGVAMLFKFVLNDGATWESIDNRTYTIATGDAQTLPVLYFNNINNLGRLSQSATANGQCTLTWTAGPRIRLQSASGLEGATWQDVPNTLGQGSATVGVNSGQAFYQLIGP
jgi:hypothetical protein